MAQSRHEFREQQKGRLETAALGFYAGEKFLRGNIDRGTLRSMTRTVIHSDREIMGGEPVFVGTRVPLAALFGHLDAGDSLDVFLESFPSVTKEQAIAALRIAREALATRANSHR